jgi:hypothetical protein
MFLKLKYIRNMKTHSLETVFGAFKNIGEVNIFEFILGDLDQRTMRYYHNSDKAKFIFEKYNLAESSQYRYLSNMVNKGVLERISKGIYKVADKWVEYGNDNSLKKKM